MPKKAKKPNCNRGYSCGMSCINVKLMCRQDGLAGQFVSLAESYFQQAKAQPVAEPKLKFNLEATDTLDLAEILSYAKNIEQLSKTKKLEHKDAILSAIIEDLGYGQKPKKIKQIDKNRPSFYRYVGSSEESGDRHIEAFKNGEFFVGVGIYGNGTYYADNKHDDDAAHSLLSKYGKRRLRGQLAEDTKIIKYDALSKILDNLDRALGSNKSVLVLDADPLDILERNAISPEKLSIKTKGNDIVTNRPYIQVHNGMFKHKIMLTDENSYGEGASKISWADDAELQSKLPEIYAYVLASPSELKSVSSRTELTKDLADEELDLIRDVLFGDVGSGSSGRLAALLGYDVIDLDGLAYEAEYRILLNRAKLELLDE